jgi:hypothetical protein
MSSIEIRRRFIGAIAAGGLAGVRQWAPQFAASGWVPQ